MTDRIVYEKIRIKFLSYVSWTRHEVRKGEKNFTLSFTRQMFLSNFFVFDGRVHHGIYVYSNSYTCHFYLNGNTHLVSPSLLTSFLSSFIHFQNFLPVFIRFLPFLFFSSLSDKHCLGKHRIQSIRRHKFASLFTSGMVVTFFISLELLASFFPFNHIE